MRRPTFRRSKTIAAVLASVAAVTSVPGSASALAEGDTLWQKRFDGAPGLIDRAADLAVSPNGAGVFVAGRSASSSVGEDLLVLAYDGATGMRSWALRYDGPAHADDSATSIGISPDSHTVFVTGTSIGTDATSDFVTMAIDAASGDRLWTRRYGGKAAENTSPSALVLSPDGGTLFVTGTAGDSISTSSFVTLAYEAPTAAVVWAKRYRYGQATALAVSDDGTQVFVTGSAWGTDDIDYGTVAYDADAGTQIWARRYVGRGADDVPSGVGVSPDGTKVFVTGGEETGATCCLDFATVAYDAASGSSLWRKRYDDPVGGDDVANALAVNPDGSAVFVTGSSEAGNLADYFTIAYDPSTGAKLWAKRYDGFSHGEDAAAAICVSADGSRVFVTGASEFFSGDPDFTTFGYAASNGALLWSRRYDSSFSLPDHARAIGVGPGGGVFVTGDSADSLDESGIDIATVSYAA